MFSTSDAEASDLHPTSSHRGNPLYSLNARNIRTLHTDEALFFPKVTLAHGEHQNTQFEVRQNQGYIFHLSYICNNKTPAENKKDLCPSIHKINYTNTMLGKELSAFGRLLDTPELMLVHIELDTDKTVPAHDHKGQEVFFTVVRGQVEVTLDGQEKHLLIPGKVLHFPGEASISARAIEPSEFFVYLINRR